MTSTANPPHSNPASNTSANSSAPSYASAAGAAKKPTSTPLIATGTNTSPAVVGSSVPAPQHAKSSSVSPVNGRPNIMPAVPAVAHGSSTNGGAAHDRKASVTMSANGPNSSTTNGGAVGGAKDRNIQFGFKESPAVSKSTPQAASAAPIPIPGSNPRVVSPAHSPSPIPQPSASGGRPPSSAQSGQMQFGSFGGNGDSHMRQPSGSQNSIPQNHGRRESMHSVSSASEQVHQGPHGGPGRGGFQQQGGRGRGYNQNYNQQMGYPPNNGFRGGPGQGRGGMPPAFQPQQQRFPNSPQPARGSPHIPPSMPAQGGPSTPNMPHAVPGMPGMPGGPQYFYPPPMGHQHQNYGYPPQQFDAMGRGMPMGYPMYPGAHMMHGQPQSPAPGYQQPYVQGQYGPQGGQPMSRNSSQVSERPNSSTSHTQPPAAAQGTPQQQPAQPKAPVVVSTPSSFARPRKSAAIVIKNAAGEALDLSNLKAPASPVPSIQQSKTPPVVASTPTPPPKPATPASHTRTESNATTKTAEEVRNEFKEKMRLAAETEAKAKDEADAKAKAAEEEKLKAEEKAKEEAEAKAKAEAEAEAKAKEEAEAKAKAEAEAKAKEEERLKAEAKAKEEAEAKAKADAEAASQKDDKPKAADEMDEEELERIIREMEEEDARREKEAEERSAKLAAERAAKKKLEDESRASNAAENDRKLREQEREMERLEEEKERKRAEAESSGKGLSVADALAQKIGGLKLSDTDSTPANDTDKLSKLGLDSKSPPASAKGTAAEKRGKPAALNLAPLNTKTVEPAQPSAALQSLKSARFLNVINQDLYPAGIHSPNPALNSAVTKKGKTFKYDPNFLLQFKGVFTEQPSMEFGQQVKTLIGDGDGGSRSGSTRTPASASARQNSRGGAGGFPPIGSFGAGAGGRTLPPGTSSQERFALSQGTMGRQQMAAFSRPGGAFPMGAGMQRTPSSSNMGGPNSPRQGSRSTRNTSKRDTMNAKAEAQAAKTMPLTAGLKIEALQTSTTGWKPSSIGQKQGPTPGADHMDPAMVQRKVKAALNKMTPENFDKISAQILAIAAQSKDETDGLTLRQVIQLTFEKATDEAHWASMYAKFCKRMLEMMSPEIRDENILDKNGQVVSGGALFRKYLLNRCQEEFERGWKSTTEDKEGESAEDKKALEAAMLSDEYYKQAAAKRRGLGLVQFIGELYKLGMLTERIMHECVRKLVDYTSMPDEAEIESLSKLLKTIGGNLDATEKSRAMMDVYFGRVQNMMDIPELPSRMKFMLLDVIDLRKAGWHSKEENKGPKTLDEVRAEAEAQAARKAAEAARTNQRGGPGGRPPMGRGDTRQFSSGFPQQNQNQVGMDDLRRLKGAVSRSASQNVTLGPTSMFSSRSNSGRRLGPGGSLGRGAEDSAASSRTGTPPTAERSSSNAFSLLATMDTDNPTSPPSTAASPALSKVTPATGDKKESN